jgi:hypothetical protein
MRTRRAERSYRNWSRTRQGQAPLAPRWVLWQVAVGWKVFKGANDGWMQEVATYHRKDGLLIKEHDDAISASRYAMMHRRFGQSAAARASFNREIQYPKSARYV